MAGQSAVRGRRVTVAGSWNSQHTITPGVLDDAAFAAFTQGQCHALALAIHEETGWPTYGCEDGEGDLEHLVVKTPDGRILDISGAHQLEDFLELEHHSCPDPDFLVELDPEGVRALGEEPDWRAPEVDVARSFVRPLLEREGLVD